MTGRHQRLFAVAATFLPCAFSSFVTSPSVSFGYKRICHPSTTKRSKSCDCPRMGMVQGGGTSPSGGESGDREGLEAMRKMLEASWDTEAMGVVPKDPQAAAEAAASSVKYAMQEGKNLILIDLLLPSYDISQGENMYDEVLAVEFCIELARSMDDSDLAHESAILVKNEIGERSVGRVLNMKEKQRMEEEDSSGSTVATPLASDDDEDDDYDEGEDRSISDDYEDFDGIGSTSVGFVDDVDLFRQQLSSSWDASDDDATSSSEKGPERIQPDPARESIEKLLSKPYRIGSLFGNAEISSGPDMFDDVIDAVDKHAIHESDDVLIVVSAFSQEEMIAVRRIFAQYEDKKPIILVNCKLDPLPREFLGAETVYSILPLIARPKVSDDNIFKQDQPKDDATPPKIVLMRRYPRDWELYVDVNGSGFELIDSAPASEVPAKGPSMKWIASCVKQHMEFKLGSE